MAEIYTREDLNKVCGATDSRTYTLGKEECEIQNSTYLGILKIFRDVFAFMSLNEILK